MNIEEKLNSVGTYFKNKVLAGDYVITKSSSATATILIDEKYSFQLWVGNDPRVHFNFYKDHINDFSVLDIPTISFNTEEEKIAGWRVMEPILIEFNKRALKKAKEERIISLQKELDELTLN